MTIDEYADAIGAELVLRRFPNQENRWMAKFDNCDVKTGTMVSTQRGEGRGPAAAVADYCERIRGQRLVFETYGREKRREFDVPTSLSA